MLGGVQRVLSLQHLHVHVAEQPTHHKVVGVATQYSHFLVGLHVLSLIVGLLLVETATGKRYTDSEWYRVVMDYGSR